MTDTPTPIEPGTELDYLLRCVADGLGVLATAGYAAGDRDRGGRAARTVTCKPFNGRFSEQEIKAIALENPGMRVSMTAITRIFHVGDGDVDLTLQFVAAIVTPSRALDWDGLAARALQAVMTGMHWTTWGTHVDRVPFLHPKTSDVNAENLFGDWTVKAGASLWAFTWQQVARLPTVSIPATADDTPGSLNLKTCPPFGRAGGTEQDNFGYTEVDSLSDWPG